MTHESWKPEPIMTKATYRELVTMIERCANLFRRIAGNGAATSAKWK